MLNDILRFLIEVDEPIVYVLSESDGISDQLTAIYNDWSEKLTY